MLKILLFLLLFAIIVSEVQGKSKNKHHNNVHRDDFHGKVGPFTIRNESIEIGQLTESSVKGNEIVIFNVNLTKQDVLDLHRIIVQITNEHSLPSDEPEYLSVWACNARSSVSFSLPTVDNGNTIYNIGRLLEPIHKTDVRKDRNQSLTIVVKSRLDIPVEFSILIRNYDRGQYLVPLNEKMSISLPHQHFEELEPLAYRINTSDIESLYIKMESADDICALVVISNQMNNIYENGGYDSLDSSSIRKMTFFRRFDLVILKDELTDPVLLYIFILSDDSKCHDKKITQDRKSLKKKVVDVYLSAQTHSNYLLPIGFIVGLVLFPFTFLLGYLISTVMNSRKDQHAVRISQIHLSPERLRYAETPSPEMEMSHLGGNSVHFNSNQDREENLLNLSQNGAIQDESNEQNETQARQNPGCINCLETIVNRENEKQWKLTDYQFMFFLFPVLIQCGLQYHEWSISYRSDELCFHNYACARQWKGFRSFNHMISNIGYAINALQYLIFIYLRKSRFYHNLGIYDNFPIEISLALAMFCQSIGSFIYHICPNKNAYHFDTPFMQVMCILAILKLYGNRHGPVSQRTCHISIAAIMGLNVLIGANLIKNTWTILTIGGAILIVGSCMIPSLSNADSSKTLLQNAFNSGVFGIIAKLYFNTQRSGKGFVEMSVWLLNLLMIFGLSFLLHANQVVTIISIVNTVLYMFYYFTQKMLNREKLTKFVIISASLALILWAIALRFFVKDVTDWRLSPAQSRTFNSPCILLDFYDTHDLWHLTSSFALFFSLIAISSVDDCLAHQDRRKLNIF